jgi:hypothetical protein
MDRRDHDHQWFSSFDARRMVIVLNEAAADGRDLELPAVYAVCETCSGHGSHVAPGIDAHGIGAEEWGEWDDEDRARYCSGGYDVPCVECHGARVVPDIDRDRTPAADLQIADDWCDDLARHRAEVAAERRYGA